MADVIYLAGKMRGLYDNGREHFRQAEMHMMSMGFKVINPARLPENLKQESYMPMCFAMLREADAIGMLPDWKDSVGAQMEYQYARETGKKVYYLESNFAFIYDESQDSDAKMFEEILLLTKEIVKEQADEYLAGGLAEDLAENIAEGMIDNDHFYKKILRDWRDRTK